jgi:hypothetical protein
VSAPHLADGPAMYLGGSIMTFALPYAAFIVIATVLFYLYRRPHYGPKLKYLTPGPIASVLTREPGPIPASDPQTATADPEPAAAGPQTADEAGSGASEGTE